MISKENVLKKLFSFSIGTWIASLISFVSVPLTTRLINPDDFGKATMFSTVYLILLFISLVGTPQSFLRFFPEKPEDEKSTLLWSSISVPILISLAISIIVFIFKSSINIFLVGNPNSYVYLIIIVTLMTGIFQTFSLNVLRAKQRGSIFSFIQIVQSLCNVSIILLYSIFINRDFYAILYSQLFSNIIALITGVYFEKFYWLKFKIKKQMIIEAIKYGYPFIFSGIFWWILDWSDRLILRLYVSFYEIGLYSAAFKIISLISLFTVGFNTFWYSFAYEQYEKNPENKLIFKKAFDYVSLVLFCIGFTLLTIKNIIFFLLAESYQKAAEVSPFLILNPLMITLAVVVARGIDFSQKTYFFILSNMIAAMFNLIGNLLLVPELGIKGSALSTGFSSIILFFTEFIISERLYPIGYNLKKIYILLGLFVFSALLHTFIDNIFLSILSSVFGFFVTIFLYKKEFTIIYFTVINFLNYIQKKER